MVSADLHRALGRLSERQRAVAVLRLVFGMNEAEVANALGIQVGTVKQHLHRARGRLRLHLGAEIA